MEIDKEILKEYINVFQTDEIIEKLKSITLLEASELIKQIL